MRHRFPPSSVKWIKADLLKANIHRLKHQSMHEAKARYGCDHFHREPEVSASGFEEGPECRLMQPSGDH
jgi:hypothetical protein